MRRQVHLGICGALILIGAATWGWSLLAGETDPGKFVADEPSVALDRESTVPTSLDALTRHDEVVILGVVTRKLGVGGIASSSPNAPLVEYTDYEVKVAEYLRGTGPETLVIRLGGNVEKMPDVWKPLILAQPSMLFVVPAVGQEKPVWGMYEGAWGQLVEEKQVVKFAADANPVVFAHGKRLADLASELRNTK